MKLSSIHPAARLFSVSAANLLLSFLYQFWVLYQLGLGATADLYFAALSIPVFLISMVSSFTSFAIFPYLAANNTANVGAMLSGFTILISSVALLLWIMADTIYPLIFPSIFLEASATKIIVRDTELGVGVLSSINLFLSSVLYARKRYSTVELTSLTSFIVVPAYVYLAGVVGVVDIAMIDLGRTLMATVILACCARVTPSVKPREWVELPRLVLDKRALFYGNILQKSIPLFDRSLASTLNSGELSLFHLSQQTNQAAQKIFSRVIVYPQMGQISSQKLSDRSPFSIGSSLRRSIYAGIVFFLLLISVVLVVYLWQPFTVKDPDIYTITLILALLMAGEMIGGFSGQTVAGYFYATGNVNAPMFAALWGVAAGLVARFALFFTFGLAGLILAVGIQQILNFWIMSIGIQRSLQVR